MVFWLTKLGRKIKFVSMLNKHYVQPFLMLEVVHTDVHGSINIIYHFQNRYFIFIYWWIDPHDMTWFYLMRKRSEVFDWIKKFKILVEKLSPIKYTSNKFKKKCCEDKGVARQITIDYTS